MSDEFDLFPSEESDLYAGAPVDGVVSDVLGDTDDTFELVDTTLAGLPVEPTYGLSDEISGTLDFINDGGSTVSDLTDTVLFGGPLTPEQIEAGQMIIDRGPFLGYLDGITYGNQISTGIRQDELFDMWEEAIEREEFNLWYDAQGYPRPYWG